MRDHSRVLGNLFIGWAAAQALVAIVVTIKAAGDRPPPLYFGLTALAAVAYAWAGMRLRAHDARVRLAAIVLSGLALLSFPVGSALGAYGLWALIRRKAVAAR